MGNLQHVVKSNKFLPCHKIKLKVQSYFVLLKKKANNIHI